MTEHINQPHELPKIPPGEPPHPFSRSNMMGQGPGGTGPWSMFMPGQSSGRRDEYPTSWPEAGSLLRVPKCVFLTSNPPAHLWGRNFTLLSKWVPYGYLGHYDDAVVRDTRVTGPTAFPFGTLIFGGFTGQYGYIGWTIDPQFGPENEGRRKWHKCCVVPNAIYAEHYRLVAEFKAAKATLEAKYPNQVFVEICEFFPNDPAMTIAPHDENMPRVFDAYTPAGYAANAPKHGSNGPAWLLGPDRVNIDFERHRYVANFFGSNFYHIYCGYQDSGSDGVPRTAEETLNRWTFWQNKMGYKLDRNFLPGYDEWIPGGPGAIPDGYEGDAYGVAQRTMDTVLSGTQTFADSLINPEGKLDNVRIGYENFAGYRVDIHEYDLTWNFPAAHFLGQASTRFPSGTVEYGDQDWVEQVIILQYELRKAIYEASPDFQYGDEYFPGADYGAYNFFVKYPGTSSYVQVLVPQLNAVRDRLKDACENMGPKAASIFRYLIERHSLGDIGIGYAGGSSGVTAESIVRSVEEHYGLGA